MSAELRVDSVVAGLDFCACWNIQILNSVSFEIFEFYLFSKVEETWVEAWVDPYHLVYVQRNSYFSYFISPLPILRTFQYVRRSKRWLGVELRVTQCIFLTREKQEQRLTGSLWTDQSVHLQQVGFWWCFKLSALSDTSCQVSQRYINVNNKFFTSIFTIQELK